MHKKKNTCSEVPGAGLQANLVVGNDLAEGKPISFLLAFQLMFLEPEVEVDCW